MTNAYKAKWIITSKEDDLFVKEDHALIVDEGKIIDVVPFSQIEMYNPTKIKDYGNSIITPGFVNLLCYLQSTLIGQKHKLSIKSTIKKIFKTLYKQYVFAFVPKSNYSLRITDILNEYFSWSRKDKLTSFEAGLEMSMLAGTTCICQISKELKYFEIANKYPMKTYMFFELYADSSKRGKTEFNIIKNKIENLLVNKSSNTFIGVAPNSIANVHKRLWRVLSKYCRKHNLLLLTHLGESEDEMDWLKYGFSDIDLLHKFIGLKKLSPHTKDISPVDYLKKLKVLSKKVIIANANYLSPLEMEDLSKTEVKFAYCPRYDDIVCGKKQPFDLILKNFPKRFGFGTDSLYNNKDLSILNEAKYANENNLLDICELVKYMTLYPSKILRLDNIIGSLEKNKHADFNIFNLNESEDYNALPLKSNPDFVYISGRRVVDNKSIRHYKK